jgi:hypothetical protein
MVPSRNTSLRPVELGIKQVVHVTGRGPPDAEAFSENLQKVRPTGAHPPSTVPPIASTHTKCGRNIPKQVQVAYRVLRRGLYFASIAGCMTSQTGRGGSAHTQNRGHDASMACEYQFNNVVKSRALFSCVVRILAQHKGPATHTPPSHLPSLVRIPWGAGTPSRGQRLETGIVRVSATEDPVFH